MVGDILRYSLRMALAAAALILVAVKGLPLLLQESPSPHATAATAPAADSTLPRSYGTDVVLDGNGAGHFQADLQVNGASLHMIVDTGATVVALSAEDAERAGIHVYPSDFHHPISTANGSLMAARTSIAEMSLGPIRMRDVDALVLPRGATRVSLLGMSFLRRLSSFQIADNRLVLKP